MVGATWSVVAPSAMPTSVHDRTLNPGAVATAIPKVNSDTNLAVQLLAALRGTPVSTPNPASSHASTIRPRDGPKQRPRPRTRNVGESDGLFNRENEASGDVPAQTQGIAASEVSTDENVDDDGTDSSGSRTMPRPSLHDTVDMKSHRNFEQDPVPGEIDPRGISTEREYLSTAASSTHVAAPSNCEPYSSAQKPSPGLSHSISNDTLYKYTREERKDALRRFKEKKRMRSFKKTIRYDIRKRLADTRPRYKGRFSKPPREETYQANAPAQLAEPISEE